MDEEVLDNLLKTHCEWNTDEQRYTLIDSKNISFGLEFQNIIKRYVMEKMARQGANKAYRILSLNLHPDKLNKNLTICEQLSGLSAFVYMSDLVKCMKCIEQDCSLSMLKDSLLENEDNDSKTLVVTFINRILQSVVDEAESSEKEEKTLALYAELLSVYIKNQEGSPDFVLIDNELINEGGLEKVINGSVKQFLETNRHHNLFPDSDLKDDIYQWIGHYKQELEQTDDVVTKALLESNIFMLEQLSKYQLRMGSVSSTVLTIMASAMPFLTAGISIATCGYYFPALCMAAAISNVMGEQKQKDQPGAPSEYFLEILERYKSLHSNFNSLTQAGFFSILGLNFVVCNHAFYILNGATSVARSGASFFLPEPQMTYETFLRKHTFNYPFVAMMYYEIECYILQQKNQAFSGWRTGWKKSEILRDTQNVLRGIDATANTEQEAVERVSDKIEVLARNDILIRSGVSATELIQTLQLRAGQLKPEAVCTSPLLRLTM